MEWIRSCYQSGWRLFGNNPVVTRGRYYFSPLGTPFYPGPHNFWSRNWITDEMDPEPLLGEVAHGRRPWSNGRPPTSVPALLLVGSADCIAAGDLFPPVNPPGQLLQGIDRRCFPGPRGGGLLLSASVVVAVPIMPRGLVSLFLSASAVPVLVPVQPHIRGPGLLFSANVIGIA